MKQILLLKQNDPNRDHLEQKLGSHEEVHINSFSNSEKTLNFLSLSPHIDLIFYSDKFTADQLIESLHNDLNQFLKKYHTNLCGSNEILKKLEKAFYIHPQLPTEKVVHIINKQLGISEHKDESEFKCIPISICASMKKPPCDLYIKVGSSNNSKYVKRFNIDEETDQEDFKNFINKSVLKLYIKKEDIQILNIYFKNKISSNNKLRISNIDQSKIKEQFFNNMKDSLDYINFLFNDVGIKNEGERIVQEILESISNKINKLANTPGSSMSDFLTNTLASEDNFSAKHVALTSMIATNMLKDSSWGTDNMISRVVYAAFFQDYSLHGSKKLISCLDEESLYEMSAEEQKKIMTHAKDAVDILKKDNLLPNEIEELILEQHGAKNGIGLPENKTSNSKMSAVFRIASEFSTKLLCLYEKTTNDLEIQDLIKSEYKRNNENDKDIFDLLSDSVII